MAANGFDIADIKIGRIDDRKGSFSKDIGDVPIDNTQTIYFIDARLAEAEHCQPQGLGVGLIMAGNNLELPLSKRQHYGIDTINTGARY